MLGRSPRSPLFPYTTLFRSASLLIWGLSLRADVPGLFNGEDGLMASNTAANWLAQLAIMGGATAMARSEEHTSELQSHVNLVCRLLLEKKNQRAGSDARRW